jgi:fructose-1,6-bisphosphatase/inositol monophosphatase family enzyme
MNPELRRALDVATAAAVEAGAILRAELHRPGGPRGGDGHAPADEEAERAIRARLLGAFPWRYLGEETGAAGPPGADTVWLVDPNDGTAVYLKARRGSAVSIAAVRSGRPILGVVYAFAYPDDRGDLIAWAEGRAITRNGAPVTTALAARSFGRESLVLVSSAADSAGRGGSPRGARAGSRGAPPAELCATGGGFRILPMTPIERLIGPEP